MGAKDDPNYIEADVGPAAAGPYPFADYKTRAGWIRGDTKSMGGKKEFVKSEGMYEPSDVARTGKALSAGMARTRHVNMNYLKEDDGK